MGIQKRITATPKQRRSWLSKAMRRPRHPAVMVKSGDDGLRLMFIVTSNAYEDREGETITSKALQDEVDRRWVGPEAFVPDQPLLFWHEGAPIGDIVWADVVDGFLVEVAKERDGDYAKAVWDYVADNPDGYEWGASHGFRYAPEDRLDDGTYTRIRKFETSVLPHRDAANALTFAGVMEREMNEERLNLLEKIAGRAGLKLAKQAKAAAAVLTDAGIEHKAADADLVAAKGMLEKLRADLAKVLGNLTDAPSEATVEQVLQMVLGTLSAAPVTEEKAPDAEAPTDAEEAGDDMVSADAEMYDDSDDDEVKALKLYTTLNDDMAELVKSQDALVGRLAALEALPGVIKELTDVVAALQKQASLKPRIASSAMDTVPAKDNPVVKQASMQAVDENMRRMFPGLFTK